jgi:hypothetical protein
VENQYDDKVGFENKIVELRIEKTKIEEEVPIYKNTLTQQAMTSAALLNLHKNGLTDETIIFISRLLLDIKNNNSLNNQNNLNNNNFLKNSSNNPNSSNNNINSNSNNHGYNSIPNIFKKDEERLKKC